MHTLVHRGEKDIYTDYIAHISHKVSLLRVHSRTTSVFDIGIYISLNGSTHDRFNIRDCASIASTYSTRTYLFCNNVYKIGIAT